MIKRIEFNLNGEIACVNASSLTTMRLWMSTPPFVKINWEELSPDQKLNVLKEVFEGSINGIPIPKDKKSNTKIEVFGFSTWESFAKNGRHCSIQFDTDAKQYEFQPLIYVKEGGLQGIKNTAEKINSTSPAEQIILLMERILDKIPRLREEYYRQEEEDSDDE
jgi:hypothetical protein